MSYKDIDHYRKYQCVTVDNPVTYSHQKLVAYITFTSESGYKTNKYTYKTINCMQFKRHLLTVKTLNIILTVN